MKICISETNNLTKKIQRIDQSGYRYEFEERAAILEYDGRYPRDEAERIAANEIINRKF